MTRPPKRWRSAATSPAGNRCSSWPPNWPTWSSANSSTRWSRRANSPATNRARWPAWGWPTTSPRRRCCPTGSSTTSPRTSATTSNVFRRSTRSRYETICHRLSTLQRPSMRGVPFSFVRVDRAGNMSKRQSATGFHFSSSGGTCPLWNVYETFANPGKILVQIAQMPDGRNYMWVARTVERRASRYGQPGKTFAIGLGCELRHAHRLVYSEGLDLYRRHRRHPDRRRLPGLRTRQLPAARLPRTGPRAGSRRTPQHGVAVPGAAAMTSLNPRACPPPAVLRDLGPINWVICRLGARGIRAPQFHLFNAMARHSAAVLDLAAVLSGVLLYWGRLSRRDAETGHPAGRVTCATASTSCSSTAGWPGPAESTMRCSRRSSRARRPTA